MAEFLTSAEVPHDPYYGYEEILATIADRPGSPSSVLAAMERLAEHVSERKVSKLQNPVSDEEREKILEDYAGTAVVQERRIPEGKSAWSRGQVFAAWAMLLLFIGIGIVFNRDTNATKPPDPWSNFRTITVNNGPVFAAVFNPDSQKCITTAAKVLQVWDCSNGAGNDNSAEITQPLEGDPVGLVLESNQPKVLFGMGDKLGEFNIQTRHLSPVTFATSSGLVSLKDCKKQQCSVTDVFYVGGKIPVILRMSSRDTFAGELKENESGMQFLSRTLFPRSDNSTAGTNTKGVLIAVVFLRSKGEIFLSSLNSEGDSDLFTAIQVRSQDITALGLDPRAEILAVASDSSGLNLYETRSGLLLKTLNDNSVTARYSTTNISFSPDGTLIAATGTDGLIRIWNVRQGTLIKTLSGHTAVVYKAVFSSDGTRLLSASSDGTARVWAIPKLQPESTPTPR